LPYECSIKNITITGTRIILNKDKKFGMFIFCIFLTQWFDISVFITVIILENF
jgi:hypothetical protein